MAHKLYKYASINNNTTSALIEKYAWYPKPASLNDPFDCGLVYSRMPGFDNGVGVLALSTNNANIIMWSHYAASHKGICIEYTDYTDEQLQSDPMFDTPKASRDELPIVRNATAVKYLTTEELNLTLHGLPQSVDEFNSQLVVYNEGPFTQEKYKNGFIVKGLQALFVKHRDWSYENEYRIVVHEGDKPMPTPGIVSTLYLGMKTSEMQCRLISKIGDAIGAKVVKMERVPGKYELLPRELTEKEKEYPKHEFERAVNGHLRRLDL